MEINVFKAKGEYNKRIHDHLDFIEKVHYKLLELPFQAVFSQNISALGMCLLMDREFKPETILELNFEMPESDSKMISTYSKVVWQKEFLTGVKFLIQ